MNPTQVIQLLVVLQELTTRLPALLEAAKAALASTDEVALKAELLRLRGDNEAAYAQANAALEAIAHPAAAPAQA